MVFLKIIDKTGAVKFTAQGDEIRETYQGEFSAGDTIQVRLDGRENKRKSREVQKEIGREGVKRGVFYHSRFC